MRSSLWIPGTCVERRRDAAPCWSLRTRWSGRCRWAQGQVPRFFGQALKQSVLLLPAWILVGWLLAGCQCGSSQQPIQWEIERETPAVRTGLTKPLTPVAIAGFQPLPEKSLIETDTTGEALLRGTTGSSVCRIYLFNDGKLEKKACPRAPSTGANTTCLEEGSAIYGHCYAHTIMTPSAEAMVTGSWAALTYLPQRELTLIILFEGTARIWPVVDTADWKLGTSLTLTPRQFLYTVPDARLDQIGDLPVPARQPLSLDQLPALTAKLGMGTEMWVDKACHRSDIENACPGCCVGLAPTRSPTPPAGTKPTSTLVPSRTPSRTPMPSPTKTPTPIPTTVELPVLDDATIADYGLGSTPSPGENWYLKVSFVSGTSRALLRFDLSGIPHNAIVDSAYMELYLHQSRYPKTVTLGVYSLTSGWNQGEVTYANGPSWSKLGITWQVEPSVLGYKSFLLMKGFVDSWRNGQNYGLGLSGPSSGESYYLSFLSSEYPTTYPYEAHPPRLFVTYHVPAP